MQVASIYGVIDLIDKLTPGLDKAKGSLSSFASNLGGQLTNVGSTLTAGLTVPILGFGAAAVKAASDTETSMTALENTLKNTGKTTGVTAKQAEQLAESLDKVTRFSKDTILDSEALLASFTHIGSKVFPDAEKAAQDLATGMKQDLGSATKELAIALDNPEKGLTRLSRAGIIFTDAQKKMIKSLQDSGNLMGAQKIILDAVEGKFRNAATAAGDTFAGKLDILNHTFTDFQEKIGNILIPILEKGMAFIGGLVDRLSKLNPNILQMGVVAAAAAAAIGPVLGILGAIATVIGFILSPIGLLIAAVAALGVAWATNFGGIRDKVMPILTNVVNFIKGTVIPAIQKLWTDVQPALQSFANWFMKDALPWIIATVEFFIINTWNPLVNAIREFWTLVSPALNSFATWFSQNIGPIIDQINKLIDAFNKASSTISKGLNLPSNALPQAAASVLTGGTTNVGGGVNLGVQLGSAVRSWLGFASGGPTGPGTGVAGFVHGSEYVVPENGALVMRGGPSTLHVVFQAQNFVDHLYVDIADAIGSR